MPRVSLDNVPCSWAKAAAAIGDQWSILIIRDAFRGVRTFSAFQRSIGLSKSVLARRLQHLVEHEVLSKRSLGIDSPGTEYRLTQKGRALFPVMIALGQWSDTWIIGKDQRPWQIVDTADREPIQTMTVRAHDGREVELDQLEILPGPGRRKP